MENFVFGQVAKEDINIGYGTFGPVVLPDGSTATLNKIGIHSFVNHVNAVNTGAVGNGTTDSTAAFQAAITALAAISSGGGAIYAPAGTYVIRGQLSAANIIIEGDGPGVTIIKADASLVPHLGVIGVSGSNVTVRNLTFDLNKSGSTISAIKFTSAATKTIVDSVEFIGTGPTDDCYGINTNYCNVTDLYVSRSRFVGISYVIIKLNDDTSITKNTVFDSISVINTASGVNVNHPSVTGSWTDITVVNSYFETMSTIGGWGVGLSGVGVKRATISNCTFKTSTQEFIHIEDGASQIAIVGNRILKTATSVADHGCIHIIGPSHDISVNANLIDISGNTGSSMVGINAVRGGQPSTPYNLNITGNNILTNSLSVGVAVSECTNVVISSTTFSNPNPSDKAAYFIDITLSRGVGGYGNNFYNPAALVAVNNNSHGTFHQSTIDGNLTSFAFLTGNSDSSTSVIFDTFTITRSYVADNATNNVLFPTGQLFNISIGLRFVQNGVNGTFVATGKIAYDKATSRLSIQDFFSYAGASSSASPNLSIVGGNLTSKAFNAGSVTGVITVTASGVYVP